MSRKAERLARELIRLSLLYTENDFSEAEELIVGGYFQNQHIRALSSVRKTKRARPASRKSVSHERDDDQRMLIASPVSDDPENQIVIEFVSRFKSGELPSSGETLREFAAEAGVELPKKTPSRAEIGKRLEEHLLRKTPAERTKIIGRVSSKPPEGSSLKRWSDLIVKREPE